MDILKQNIAPITDEAWDEINEVATEIFNSVLSARKFVDIDGPHGLDYGAVHTGRIDTGSNKKSGVQYGINQLMPLVEARVGFSLDLWELDNASRGAQDLDLSSLEKAARQISEFEELTIYNGLKKANIDGLKQEVAQDSSELPESSEELLLSLSKLLVVFNRNGVEGPYSLVVSENEWERLAGEVNGYPLSKHVKSLLKGSIILSPFIDGAYLVSERGGDFQLTLGQDLSIGYQFHDKDSVELYVTESFTFQCFEPAAAMLLQKMDKD